MNVERSSLCNCVVNFLLEENYLLTAFELLHELLDDGRDAQAIRLKEFFSDPSRFPPDQISKFNFLRVVDPQSLLEEKEALEEKFAINEYELRLAQEDIVKLKTELHKKSEITLVDRSGKVTDTSANNGPEFEQRKRDASFSDLGPLKENERQDINCAVKEYLVLAGYRLTAMTFYEEVTDQKLDIWENSAACVPDSLRRYYYQYLSSTTEAAQEKLTLVKENENLKKEQQSLLKNKDESDSLVVTLRRSMEALQKDIKDKEILVHDLKQSLECQRKELNECRGEVTSLKMHIEEARSGRTLATNSDHGQAASVDSYKEEVKLLQNEIERLKLKHSVASESSGAHEHVKEIPETKNEVVDVHENSIIASCKDLIVDSQVVGNQTVESGTDKSVGVSKEILLSSSDDNATSQKIEDVPQKEIDVCQEDNGLSTKSGSVGESNSGKGLETIQILTNALPKIVPYVLINHREELLPLIMCAIERHPHSSVRDSLTHTLFNLIKRPDEQQRRIIMDACVTLAKNVGEMRTETELLPQCWEQINHMYEERRLLVAQSCGELAEFVRPEIRDSLILSIVQQLIEDSATVVREAAAHNLALLLPLFPNTEKYFKVEEMMFQLNCDPSGLVVETSMKELVPALINWGNKLDNVLRVLFSHILGSVERCPPLSGVEGSIESHLHVLGERERWNVDVLLQLLAKLVPFVHQKAIETCPFPSFAESTGALFSTSLLELYARGGHAEWPAFEWLHVECFPCLIRLAYLLPQKEDNLRKRITKFLLAVSQLFGDMYLTHIMLPVFLVAVGDNADLTFFPSTVQSKIKGFRPNSAVAERLANMGVLPILLAGVLGFPSKSKQLSDYLKNLFAQVLEGQPAKLNTEINNSVRFLCMFEEHHNMIFNILWEMVVSSNTSTKISAANLLRVFVPYVDAKVASTHVLPALVTLGSDQNLNVKYASIDAFGAVAQHFKDNMIVDKICVQMDAFLEDGSLEATIAVVRALVVAVPHTTDKLRDYLLSKIFQFTNTLTPTSDVIRRRERANAFCESIRALDATDLSAASVRDFFLPAIQNLLKDIDALDPAHKEALEIIMRERSGGRFDSISKVMGAHLGLASSMTSFFGESGLLGKKESGDAPAPAAALAVASEPAEPPKPAPQPPAEDTRLRRIMVGTFTDMLRFQSKE